MSERQWRQYDDEALAEFRRHWDRNERAYRRKRRINGAIWLTAFIAFAVAAWGILR